ncbi:hypothetical protein ILUMI_23692 [Ignelater luminosus]|uniref:Integrase catalytic domain-containing protein n=1 Tax=Ignelater luminosus TaxID=2038154 RepID=A0A8K0CBZ0_IGNLU|nr:hypothetical protein ILUMI_23692 [Ignelater luminosus]
MGTYYFILIDAFTRWPEIHSVKNITTSTTINICNKIFSSFGLPQVLVSDNGRQFLSYEFKNFLESNDIIHKVGAPYHPATNGLAEKTVQSFKNALKALRGNNNDRNRDLQAFLFNYRITPHTITGESLSKLLFGRQIRNRLDLLYPKVTHSTRDTPTRTQLKTRILQEGDRVSVRSYQNSKWQFGYIHKVLGKLHYLVRLDDNNQIC